MFLLLANYPLIQKRMRHEIEEVIGDRMPDNKDIEKCVYVTAFVYETLRFRPVLPFGVIHKTTRPIELGNSAGNANRGGRGIFEIPPQRKILKILPQNFEKNLKKKQGKTQKFRLI